ncbi:EAL domain-containing protein [Clostridium sp. C8-1-8]|uniref:EAL domain-containing protein n=1 Tax=Clostridium sp. C8-1-8 TaxID=2698831 RepID=UPI001922B33C|nr:EAL domain-containing protein [Clostridium sp. C8-1-8]
MTGKCGFCSIPLDFDFTFAYQPIVNTKKNSIFAYEALVRGINGESAYSVLSQVTEELKYSFDQKCRYKAIELASKLDCDSYLSINFMPRAVYKPEICISSTLESAKKFDFPLNNIIFEVSEQEKTDEFEHIAEIFKSYKGMGFKTAIDDFGAGNSGLLLLAKFVPDIIKLDRELVKDIHKDDVKYKIVANIVKMCRDLGVLIIAEGIEQAEEVEVLTSVGIDLIQGYYFSKPILETLPKIIF